MTPKAPAASRQILFDSTPEIFATDNHGAFSFSLVSDKESRLETQAYDEVRFVISVWHPASDKNIDLDRAYVELRASFDPEEDHWTRLAEIEPVVHPYNSGESFDGWIVLPVLASVTSFALCGSGFEARSRLQVRASAYFVA